MAVPNRLITVGQNVTNLGFDNTSTAKAPAPIRRTDLDYSGDNQSVQYGVSSGAGNGYCRGHVVGDATNFPTVGDTFWWGGAFYFPSGFKAAVQGEVDLLRWDNIDQDPANSGPERCGGIVMGPDKHIYLMSNATNLGASNYITYHVDAGDIITEGRWYWLEARTKVHQTDGSAINELWVNGSFVSSSTAKNVLRSDWQASRLRAGIVAINEATQTNALNVVVDRVYAKASQLGPVADTTPPGVPTGLTATAATNAINLSWTNPLDPDFAGVQVFRSTTSGGPYTQVGGDLAAPASSYHDASVAAGVPYYYVVRSFDNA